jgi:hypothetical protein
MRIELKTTTEAEEETLGIICGETFPGYWSQ